jgi:hypothetical protein
MRPTKFVLAFVLSIFIAATAAAGPIITLNGEAGQAVTVYAPGTLAAGGVGTTAGAFFVSGDLGVFEAYCIDLKHYINPNGQFQTNVDSMANWSTGSLAGPNSSLFGGAQASWLYNNYWQSAVGNNATRAALQLSIWEVLYDSGYNILGGTGFYATGVSSAAQLAAANMLASLPQGMYGDAAWLQLMDDGQYTQDLIGPVPEPATLLLLSTGLIGAAWASRRRKG